MALVNFVMFMALKILGNLVSMQNFLNAITDVNEISKSVQHDLNFILNVLSESTINFA